MSREHQSYPYEPEFSIKKLFAERFEDILYVLGFKKELIVALVVGALTGIFITWYKAPTYTARLTFVVDDSKSSGGGGSLSALAGLVGVNLDAVSGGNGVLAGDNVEQLVKSHKLIKQTLETAYDSTQTLADRYSTVNKLDKKWLKYSADGTIIRFPLNGVNNTRLQDSLLQEMTILILENQFEIAKADKKLGFFEVNVTMKDEKLALLFCNRMIKQSTDFYVQTKTKRLTENVRRLQLRADSIERLLNNKTYSASAASQSLLDLNPAYKAENANVEMKDRNKTLLATVYTETVKSLESSKTVLSQETPTVQIVDEPELPLTKHKLKYYIITPVAAVLSVLLLSLCLLMFRQKLKPVSKA